MTRPRRSVFLASAFASVVAIRGGPLRAQSAPVRLRVGATNADSSAEALFAQQTGRFRQAGLDVEIVALSNSNAIAAGVAGGDLDAGVTSPLQLAIGLQRGVQFRLVAGGALSTAKDPTTVLCALKTSPVRGAKDLEGKTVCMQLLKSPSELALDAWFAQSGADIGKLKLIEIVHSEMVAALQRGTVDAAIFSEPSLTEALATNLVQPIAEMSSPIARSFMNSGWFVMADFAQRNPAVVARFAATIHDTGRWANGNHAESGRILAAASKLDPGIIGRMVRAQYAESLRAGDVQPLLDAAVKYGLLPAPVAANDLILHA